MPASLLRREIREIERSTQAKLCVYARRKLITITSKTEASQRRPRSVAPCGESLVCTLVAHRRDWRNRNVMNRRISSMILKACIGKLGTPRIYRSIIITPATYRPALQKRHPPPELGNRHREEVK